MATALLSACASPQENRACDAAYPLTLQSAMAGDMILARLLPLTGADSTDQEPRTRKASVYCNLTWNSDNSIAHECFSRDAQTGTQSTATPEQARALIDAFHLAEIPESRDAGTLYYALESIQCVAGAGCRILVEPPCNP
jgi:hypothetical protein